MSFDIIREVKFLIKKLDETPNEKFFAIQVNKELLSEKDIKSVKKLISIHNMNIIISRNSSRSSSRNSSYIIIKIVKKVY